VIMCSPSVWMRTCRWSDRALLPHGRSR